MERTNGFAMRKQVTEYTCDVCGGEVDESIIIPTLLTFERKLEMSLQTDDDICIYCFIKAVNKLDPRPKAIN